MTDAEIRAYLIDAYTRAIEAARDDYRWHKTTNSCPPNHRCPHRLARKTT